MKIWKIKKYKDLGIAWKTYFYLDMERWVHLLQGGGSLRFKFQFFIIEKELSLRKTAYNDGQSFWNIEQFKEPKNLDNFDIIFLAVKHNKWKILWSIFPSLI